MDIRADQRLIRHEKDPEGVARLQVLGARVFEERLEIARLMARLDEKVSWLGTGCTSAEDMGPKLCGLSREEGRLLLQLGRAMTASPELARRVETHEVPFEAAAAIAEVLLHPPFQRAGDDWIGLAAAGTLRQVRREVKRRVEQVKQGEERLYELNLQVTGETVDKFERARVIASRQAKQTLTRGQTLDRVLDDWLEQKDPLLQKGGTRRLPDTRLLPHSRVVPADVEREIHRRARDHCECCGRAVVRGQLAHLVPHRHGGGRETTDLAWLCGVCHVQLDAGYLWLERGWPAHPEWKDAWGNAFRPRGAPGEGPPGSCGPTSDRGNGSGEVREEILPFAASRNTASRNTASRNAASRVLPCGAPPRGPPRRGAVRSGRVRRARDPCDPLVGSAGRRACRRGVPRRGRRCVPRGRAHPRGAIRSP